MTRREFLDAVGLALTGALAGFLTGRALVGEEVEEGDSLTDLLELCEGEGTWRTVGPCVVPVKVEPETWMDEDAYRYFLALRRP